PTTEVPVLDPGPLRAGQLVARLAEEHEYVTVVAEAHRYPGRHVRKHAEYPDDRGRVDRGGTGPAVEARAAAGDRETGLGAAVGESASRLGELPQDRGV